VRGLALGLFVGLVVAGLAARDSFGSAETASWAFRLSQRAQVAGFHAPVGPVAIVAIDDYTCRADWHGCSPVPRADTAVVLDKLRAAGARLIALDQLFTVWRPGTDQLVTAMHRAGSVVAEQSLGENCLAEACMQSLQPPLAPLASAALGVGLANYACGAPARLVEEYALGCPFQGRWYPSVAVVLFRRLRNSPLAYQGGGTIRLNYAGPPGQTFTEYSYRTIVESQECLAQGRHVHCPGVQGADLWDALTGKVVLIGRTDALDSNSDRFTDPLGSAVPLPGVEVHATALNTLLNDDPILVLPPWLDLALPVVLALALAALATAAGLGVGVGLGLLALALYYALSFAAVAVANLRLPAIAPEVSMAASFLLVLGARFTLEEREGRRARHLLARFVAPAVAEDLAADARRYAAGERRAIAVLFSDVRGFTTLSERTDPEVVMGALRTYFTRMVAIVHAHGGTVDKFIGDGLMALFGAPVAISDPCLAALRAALAMQAAMPAINALLAASLGAELRIGVGINYGDAVFGLSGAPSKLELTAIGDTVNIAARLESLCRDQGCSIVLSEPVYIRLPEQLRGALRDLGIVNVKGRQAGLHVYGLDVSGEQDST
jgi:adenylate cyclase